MDELKTSRDAPIRIGLLGYGKMGKAIETVAQAHGDHIVWRMNRKEWEEASDTTLRLAEVIIEFTSPESAYDNIARCLKAGIPVVTGTTGWQDRLPEISLLVDQLNGALLYASNFSIGVNLFFAINDYAARLMARYKQYQPAIEETHHIQKKDAPSGTAISLAQQLLRSSPEQWDTWTLVKDHKAPPKTLPIHAIREDDVPGTHLVTWKGNCDSITLGHKAFDRSGFAEGAHYAAHWLPGKKGVFTMQDVLDFQ